MRTATEPNKRQEKIIEHTLSSPSKLLTEWERGYIHALHVGAEPKILNGIAEKAGFPASGGWAQQE